MWYNIRGAKVCDTVFFLNFIDICKTQWTGNDVTNKILILHSRSYLICWLFTKTSKHIYRMTRCSHGGECWICSDFLGFFLLISLSFWRDKYKSPTEESKDYCVKQTNHKIKNLGIILHESELLHMYSQFWCKVEAAMTLILMASLAWCVCAWWCHPLADGL